MGIEGRRWEMEDGRWYSRLREEESQVLECIKPHLQEMTCKAIFTYLKGHAKRFYDKYILPSR